jgi:hypothetical protein
MIRDCHPPYVLGVCGTWGSGKTSFLRKLWAYLGGPFDVEGRGRSQKNQQWQRRKWFGPAYEEPPSPKVKNGWHVIWFNPWQHQFEQTPLLALLHEIRQHFSLIRQTFDETGKLLDVTVHSAMNTLSEFARAVKLPIPIPGAKGIMERGREYEAEHLETALSSQRFRDFFAKAIETVIGANGRMVIFIDDLDRCEGEVAYRLLESLKLYLNAHNCVYVLGLDQSHLEDVIARTLSGSEASRMYRPLARDYLGKMFQSLFLLPVPENTETFVDAVLDPKDTAFTMLLQERYGLAQADWPQLIRILDQNLPHNPRKIKAFISTWKLYLRLLAHQRPAGTLLNWRLTVILNYLGQFEEPLFRKVEEAPGFYSDQVVRFCRSGISTHPLFDGLELPYGATAPMEEVTGGLEAPTSTAVQPPPSDTDSSQTPRPQPWPRVFWISRLVNTLASEHVFVDATLVRQHLLRTGGPLPPPPQ